MRIVLLIPVFLTVLAFSAYSDRALAHGTGLTFTATTSAGYVDIDYETFSIESMEPGRFDFKLFADAERTKPIEYSQVWVRIKRDDGTKTGETLFSGWIADALFGSTGLTYQFPKSGTYTLLARYQQGDTELVDTSFELSVEPGRKERAFTFTKEFFTGLGGGLSVALLAMAVGAYRRIIRRRTKTSS